ncbi:MAG TPA: carbon-nitrogen hydrolase family protein [Candidatus Sumerlaeota bacterium]|nr:carbon-nitrogen hydrolase family protein [Candidatus Sumerlaeota bacterium]HOR28645.1 carbon-nitrogen hydrolase family protein [Candidatus Sumerlaeota bacterium]
MIRKVNVAAFTIDRFDKQPRRLEDNLNYASDVIDEISGSEQPDIICMTETFDTRLVSSCHPEMAQTADGPTVTRMREKARQHGCYIICPIIERRGEHIYNTCVVLDRNGEICGRYDKIHPTAGPGCEVEDYIIPGDPAPTIIETDFARIGCQICFDANWWRNWDELKQAGAEIIFFSSAYPAGRVLHSMATLFHVPIVAATCRTSCRIIDIDGLDLNWEAIYQKWVAATLRLDSPLFHLDFHFEKIDRLRADLGRAIEIKIYPEEAWWRILPRDQEVDVQELIRAYELVPLEQYLANAEAIQCAGRREMKKTPVLSQV